ncbi:HNH endonuclease signature motif containing protein [Halobacterium sp. KA-6]|uniref:HNH endonuclease signature motif containing protein n=1 Tax=Halobacterium sp. KA-6 TaxID=2896368 RepID=UPI001E437C86|nr:HNH endonuclease signature motif containing protein [Halobacterium sp. KA-6]MCD2204434.1 HNH endonuclease [Halobacterium sp. KA-6]
MTLSSRRRLELRVRDRHRERFWTEYDRESYTCPSCGYEARGVDGEFHVHHIDGDWLNGHPLNLIGLCARCHKRVHGIVAREAALQEWKARVEDLGKESKPYTGVISTATGWSA